MDSCGSCECRDVEMWNSMHFSHSLLVPSLTRFLSGVSCLLFVCVYSLGGFADSSTSEPHEFPSCSSSEKGRKSNFEQQPKVKNFFPSSSSLPSSSLLQSHEFVVPSFSLRVRRIGHLISTTTHYDFWTHDAFPLFGYNLSNKFKRSRHSIINIKGHWAPIASYSARKKGGERKWWSLFVFWVIEWWNGSYSKFIADEDVVQWLRRNNHDTKHTLCAGQELFLQEHIC